MESKNGGLGNLGDSKFDFVIFCTLFLDKIKDFGMFCVIKFFQNLFPQILENVKKSEIIFRYFNETFRETAQIEKSKKSQKNTPNNCFDKTFEKHKENLKIDQSKSKINTEVILTSSKTLFAFRRQNSK